MLWVILGGLELEVSGAGSELNVELFQVPSKRAMGRDRVCVQGRFNLHLQPQSDPDRRVIAALKLQVGLCFFGGLRFRGNV